MILLPYFLLHIYLGKREKGFKRESRKILNIMYLIIFFYIDNKISAKSVKTINSILTLRKSYNLSFRFLELKVKEKLKMK